MSDDATLHPPATHVNAPVDPGLARAWRALEGVTDPEIPVISIVDMGMVARVDRCDETVVVEVTPTFAGCPAIDVIRRDILRALDAAGYLHARVEIVFDPPWSSDRISEEGRRKLRAFGLAPPAMKCGASVNLAMIESPRCPYCDSADTTLESIFGPTLCRAIHYCNACRQSFEQFKPV
jgi:ring-1,2-phenylacetyl-CoA epoxidase subunit PaaD